jgi:Fe2+ or Zn2+ uptake regulation protein
VTSTDALDTAERLRGAGLRVTDSRRAVVEALVERPHASADELFGIVARTVPGTSLQSVYNALGDFVDAGLARRIEPAGRPGLFELRVADNHHHLICSQCGAVEDVDCVIGAAPCLTPSDAHGYAVQVAEVTFWGVCPACARASGAGGAAASLS